MSGDALYLSKVGALNLKLLGMPELLNGVNPRAGSLGPIYPLTTQISGTLCLINDLHERLAYLDISDFYLKYRGVSKGNRNKFILSQSQFKR